MSRRPSEFADFPADLATLAPYGPYRAFVRWVVDGDTIDAFVDRSFSSYGYHVMRLADIQAPEINRPETRERGLIVKARVEALVLGKHVVIHTRKDEVTFGRYVAFVTYRVPEDSGASGGPWRDLGETLVEEGLAVRRRP